MACAILLTLSPLVQAATTFPTPNEANWTAKNVTFNSGEKLDELHIHYYTIGDKSKPAVLLLPGTNQPVKALLARGFAGELFGPGQALDSSKYFIIIPESIGSGKSSKPSDGLRMAFPHYDYDDIVTAQYRLLKEGLGISHLRLVMGYSMGRFPSCLPPYNVCVTGWKTWCWACVAVRMLSAPAWSKLPPVISIFPAAPSNKSPHSTRPPPASSRSWRPLKRALRKLVTLSA